MKKYLFLDRNQIVAVPSTMFLGLTNLIEVHLNGNPVYEIYGYEYLQSLCDPNPECEIF